MARLDSAVWNLRFENCLMNASGARCQTENELRDIANSRAGAVVIKSASIGPRLGNPEPRYFETSFGSINSMGLPNLGYQEYCKLIPKLKQSGKPVMASVAGFSVDEFHTLVSAYDAAQADVIEVNLSCPNIAGKSQACYDLAYSEKILEAVRPLSNSPLTVKLSPFLDIAPREEMAHLLKKQKMNGAVLINSVGNALVVDPQAEQAAIKPKFGQGGLGGLYIKPIALANVHTFSKILGDSMPIIGVGGIQTGLDAFEHILCGAALVQVGSAFQKEGVGVFERIESELLQIMKQKNYSSLDDFRGNLKPIE